MRKEGGKEQREQAAAASLTFLRLAFQGRLEKKVQKDHP